MPGVSLLNMSKILQAPSICLRVLIIGQFPDSPLLLVSYALLDLCNIVAWCYDPTPEDADTIVRC